MKINQHAALNVAVVVLIVYSGMVAKLLAVTTSYRNIKIIYIEVTTYFLIGDLSNEIYLFGFRYYINRKTRHTYI